MTDETCPLEHVVVDTEDAGERADVVVGRRLAGVSRRVARALALAGRLRIDGQVAPPSTRVRLGQRLELRVQQAEARAELQAPVILAVSEALVYVDKPAGLATHRLRPDEAPALVDLVAERFPECRRASADPREGGAIHRLDRATSGVVALARDPAVWRALRAAFADRRIGKLYAAIVPASLEPPGIADPPLPGDVLADLARLGVVATARGWIDVDAPLGHGDARSRVAVRPAGRPATSRVLPLAEVGRGTLVAVDLITGHRHQARVHLQALGAPILGDLGYGGAAAERLFLHAWRLDLGAAWPGEAPVVAPLPADFIAPAGPGPGSPNSAGITEFGGDP